MTENLDVIRTYMAIGGQVRTTTEGMVVDLDHNAVWKFIEKNEMPNQVSVFSRTVSLFHRQLELEREKKESAK